MTTPTFSVGDVVRVRTAAGVWRIVELRLVAGEAECVRAGRAATRTFNTADLLPANDEATR